MDRQLRFELSNTPFGCREFSVLGTREASLETGIDSRLPSPGVHPVESPFDADPSLLLSSPYHSTVHLAAFGAECAARPTAKTAAAG